MKNKIWKNRTKNPKNKMYNNKNNKIEISCFYNKIYK